MIDRRAFILAATGGLLAAPLAAEAEPAGTVPRIGYLGISPSDGGLEPFQQGLRELGRVEGQSIAEGLFDEEPALRFSNGCAGWI